MTDESNTLPEGGTDNVTPSDSDTPESWDYFDPDEDTEDSPEADEGTDDEAADEAPDEGAEEADDQTDEEAAEDTAETPPQTVKLDSGEEVTIDDLKNGYLRQSDYTRKAQEVANDRNALKANLTRMERTQAAFVDYLTSMVPTPPEPSLAMSDPNRYTALKVQHDVALAKVQELIELGGNFKGQAQEVSQEDRRKALAQEDAKLVQALPETATREGREKFFTGISKVGQDLGFAPDELRGISDHRMFVVLDMARKGMEAEKAKSKVRAKAEKAPPATPRKPGQAANKSRQNADAMRRLGKSGSFRDALQVDFE